MRIRAGKGEVMAFDTEFVIHLEKMKKEKGFYPSLRELAESLSCYQSKKIAWGHVHRSLKRLAAAGKLSDEAMTVYATTHKENKKNEKGN